MIYTATAGALTNLISSASVTAVASDTTLSFELKPAHLIPAASEFRVVVPADFTLTDTLTTACILSATAELNALAKCEIKTNTVIITSGVAT
jgi:hypothetical protein